MVPSRLSGGVFILCTIKGEMMGYSTTLAFQEKPLAYPQTAFTDSLDEH